MRIVIDAREYDQIGAYRWDYKVGYLATWTQAQIDDARSRGELLGLVDNLAQSPGAAEIIAWEPGSVQNPFTLQSWVRARNDLHADAVVRCSRADLSHVLNILSTDYFRLWLTDLSATGEPPMAAPELMLPKSVTLLGICYVEGPHSGGPYNMSVFYDDSWHTPDDMGAAPPADPGTMAGGPDPALEHDPVPAEISGQIPLEETMPDPTDSLPGIPVGLPSPPPAGSAASTRSSAASPRPVAAGALSTSSATAPAPTSPASPSSPGSPSGPVTTGVRLDPATSTMSATPPPLQVFPVPVKAAAPASGPGPVQSPKLDHDWIITVLRNADDVANTLRTAGAPAVAQLLHQAVTHSLETGRLLQLAGL